MLVEVCFSSSHPSPLSSTLGPPHLPARLTWKTTRCLKYVVQSSKEAEQGVLAYFR